MVLKFTKFVSSEKENSGVAPEPVHFRMGSKKASKRTLEEQSPQDPEDWEKHNDNTHLGTKGSIKVHGHTWEPGTRGHYNHHADEVSSILSKTAKEHNLSKKHVEAVEKYTGKSSKEGSSSLNRALVSAHKKGEKVPEKHKEQIQRMDKVTKRPLGHDLHVYSGLGFNPKHHIDSNGHLHLPAYTSTTHHKGVASSFADERLDGGETDEKHILHVHVKSSDHAAHVSHLGYRAGQETETSEHETILPRNTTLKIHPKPDVLSDGTHVWHAHIHKQEKD